MWIWMVVWLLQAESLLQLFIPDVACLEYSCDGGFKSIDFVGLLEFACSNVMVKCTHLLELLMHLETLTFHFGHHLHCSFEIVNS